jgi:excisionase family DNA binding protein
VAQAALSDRKHTDTKCMISERPQPEWLDLKALQEYACVSERTLREWIHRAVHPLPAVRVGCKILVRRTEFDRWLEAHGIKHIDVGCIVDELVAGVKGMD